MLPFVQLTRLLFGKLQDRFKRCDTYFFHNTIYGTVFKDDRRIQGLPTADLLRRNPDTRLLVIGDAAMAPEELLYPRGSISGWVDDHEPSLVWLQRLRDRFNHSVWLNPVPRDAWAATYGRTTIQRIGEVFRMEDLTLGGIKRAVEHLNRK
jgi:uncharacterized protein with von Willebrand factor type A (vWA) domain